MNFYKGWMMNVWRKEDADAQLIKVLKMMIGILVFVCLALCLGWISSPSRLTIYIPPDIQNGATIKAGSIPASLIYSFTYEVWQELNYWPENGEMDYKKNLVTYRPYLTQQFNAECQQEYDELKKSGQLQRIRYLQGASGAAYDSMNIKQLSSNTWEVDLKMRLTEYKNNQPVKDVDIIYPLKITRVNVSQHNNPYGLAIAGFIAEPKRLNTYI